MYIHKELNACVDIFALHAHTLARTQIHTFTVHTHALIHTCRQTVFTPTHTIHEEKKIFPRDFSHPENSDSIFHVFFFHVNETKKICEYLFSRVTFPASLHRPRPSSTQVGEQQQRNWRRFKVLKNEGQKTSGELRGGEKTHVWRISGFGVLKTREIASRVYLFFCVCYSH